MMPKNTLRLRDEFDNAATESRHASVADSADSRGELRREEGEESAEKELRPTLPIGAPRTPSFSSRKTP